MHEEIEDIEIHHSVRDYRYVYPSCRYCYRGCMIPIHGIVEFRGNKFRLKGSECDYCEEREFSTFPLEVKS